MHTDMVCNRRPLLCCRIKPCILTLLLERLFRRLLYLCRLSFCRLLGMQRLLGLHPPRSHLLIFIEFLTDQHLVMLGTPLCQCLIFSQIPVLQVVQTLMDLLLTLLPRHLPFLYVDLLHLHIIHNI